MQQIADRCLFFGAVPVVPLPFPAPDTCSLAPSPDGLLVPSCCAVSGFMVVGGPSHHSLCIYSPRLDGDARLCCQVHITDVCPEIGALRWVWGPSCRTDSEMGNLLSFFEHPCSPSLTAVHGTGCCPSLGLLSSHLSRRGQAPEVLKFAVARWPEATKV